MEISERIKRPEPRKDPTDRSADAPIPRKQGNYTKAPFGASFGKDSKVSCSGKTMDLKDIDCFKCHKKGHYAKKCPDAKAKDGKGYFKVGSSKIH